MKSLGQREIVERMLNEHLRQMFGSTARVTGLKIEDGRVRYEAVAANGPDPFRIVGQFFSLAPPNCAYQLWFEAPYRGDQSTLVAWAQQMLHSMLHQ